MGKLLFFDGEQPAIETGGEDAGYVEVPNMHTNLMNILVDHFGLIGSDAFIYANNAVEVNWLKAVANQGEKGAQAILGIIGNDGFIILRYER